MDALRTFYANRSKELGKGLTDTKAMYHIHDDQGNLVTRTKTGGVAGTIVIPSYRPPSLEELDALVEQRQENIAQATAIYDDAYQALHQEYRRPDRSPQRILELTRQMEQADHQLQYTRFPLQYISKEKHQIRRIDFQQPTEERKFPYPVAIRTVSPYELQDLYVREGALPQQQPQSQQQPQPQQSQQSQQQKPVLFILDAEANENGFMALDWPVQIRLRAMTYHCAKQALAAELAKSFKDNEGFRRVMDAPTPAQVSYTFEDVKESPEAWAAQTKRHLYDIHLAKFMQYPELQSRLLATGDALLAAYLPRDDLLGIGIAVEDPRAKVPVHWRGQNLLGKTLMELRDLFRAQGIQPAAPIPPPQGKVPNKRPKKVSLERIQAMGIVPPAAAPSLSAMPAPAPAAPAAPAVPASFKPLQPLQPLQPLPPLPPS